MFHCRKTSETVRPQGNGGDAGTDSNDTADGTVCKIYTLWQFVFLFESSHRLKK